MLLVWCPVILLLLILEIQNVPPWSIFSTIQDRSADATYGSSGSDSIKTRNKKAKSFICPDELTSQRAGQEFAISNLERMTRAHKVKAWGEGEGGRGRYVWRVKRIVWVGFGTYAYVSDVWKVKAWGEGMRAGISVQCGSLLWKDSDSEMEGFFL